MRNLRSITISCPGAGGECGRTLLVKIDPARPMLVYREGGADPPESAEIKSIEGCAAHAEALWESDEFYEAVVEHLADEEEAARDRMVDAEIDRRRDDDGRQPEV